jgi:YD repeat-containing protein
VEIAYGTDALTGNDVWTVTDSANRTHTIKFVSKSYDGDSRASLDRIQLATFDGPATWQFVYSSTMTSVGRPCSGADQTQEVSMSAFVPLLEKITPPLGNGYSFVYDGGVSSTCDYWTGQAVSATLPTLGKIGFGWGRYQLPASSAVEAYYQQSRGVATRTLYEPVWNATTNSWNDAAAGRTWTYSPALDRPYNNTTDATPRELTTTVTDPAQNVTHYYFNVIPIVGSSGDAGPTEYGLPYSPIKTDGDGRFQSTAVRQSSGATVRSDFVLYEFDSGTATTPADVRNARVASRRVRFDGDNSAYVDTDHADYDGFGNYETTTVSGSFGAERTSTADYLPPTTNLWILGRPASTSQSENGITARQSFCYDGATGALTRRRVVANLVQAANDTVDPPASDDVLDIFGYDEASRGNVAFQKTYGGDTGTLPSTALCDIDSSTLGTPAVHVKHTYSPSGALASSRYANVASVTNLTFLSVDNDIDANTRLVRTSRDTALKATTYDYDKLGRPKGVTPPGETARTFSYSDASLSGATYTPARMESLEGGSVRAVETYDPFGRLTREKRLMPDGSWSMRAQSYTATGWLHWTSGFESIPAGVSETNFNPLHKTTYSQYDALGRAGQVSGPDGSVTTTAYAGRGMREVVVTQKVSATQNRVSTQRYDHHGRLVAVSTSASAAATYGYDVGNRLASVDMVASDLVTQQRIFTYDGRWFLQSEKHPESGTTRYEYDARGRILTRKHDAPAGGTVTDATFEYDAAERTTFVKDSAGALIKEFEYGTSGDDRGKLYRAKRHNRHPSLGDIVVTDTYEYNGTTGRAAAKTTSVTGGPSSRTEFIYNGSGELWKVHYPTCTSCSAGAPSRTVENGYANGFLTSVVDGQSSALLAYHANGMLNTVTRMLGQTTGPVWTQAADVSGLPRSNSIAVTGFCADFVWQSHPASTTVTAGTTVSLSAAANGASSYQWFERQGQVDTQMDGQTGQTLNVTVNATRRFFVRARAGSCSSDSEIATVTVTTCTAPVAALTISAAQVQPSQEFQASVADAGAGATYAWTITNGIIVAGHGTRMITIQAGCSGTVGVAVSVAKCSSSATDSEQIPVTPPVITVTSAPTSMPVRTSGSASIAPITGATYVWSITNGTITSGATQSTVQFSSNCDDVTLTVVATLACGASATQSIAIPVTGAPTASVSGATTITQGQSATLTLTLTGTGPWTIAWADNVTTTTPPSSRVVSPPRSKRYQLTSVTDQNCTRAATSSVLVTVIPPAPVALNATATGSSSVQLTWSFSGVVADRFRVERRTGGSGFVPIAEPAGTSYVDTAVSPNTAYLYRIRAITESSDGVAVSDPSSSEIATTVAFSNQPLVAGTSINGEHITQLRSAANAARATAGLSPATFTNQALTGVSASAVHIVELRAAINQARAALGLAAWSYTDGSLAAGHPIRAVHIQELREGVR